MEETPHTDAHPSKKADPFVLACVAFAGFGLLLFLPAFFFSLGSLISTGGRAWEYDPVREPFIAGVVIFVLIVALPLLAAYGRSRAHARSNALMTAAAMSSGLVGILFLMIGIRMTWPGSVIIIAPCFALSVYAFWSLRRSSDA
ncbi:MAG TPA: hypothetical protein VEZ40_08665 [Pyrinomonadaceae bacterium]|nr:hypothetical protein [Pyrinomonadaceae bacterium]